MQWFLVLSVSSCLSGGIDPGIIPNNCRVQDGPRIAMPSQEVCQQIKRLNAGSECWAKQERNGR